MKINEPNLVSAKARASKITDEFCFHKPEDIQVEYLAMALNVLVVEGALEGSEARLVRDLKHGIITVNQNCTDARRKRFGIAHELGHWCLHKSEKHLDLCKEEDFMLGDTGDQLMEIEANAFAAELLMPRSLFHPRCQTSYPSLNQIEILSQEFNTSFTSTAMRYVDFNKEKCFFILSKNGIVQWSKKKTNGSELWIEKGHNLVSKSVAWSCWKEKNQKENSKIVSPDCWFPNRPSHLQIEVKEHSMNLGQSPYTASLLIVQEDEKGNFFDMDN